MIAKQLSARLDRVVHEQKPIIVSMKTEMQLVFMLSNIFYAIMPFDKQGYPNLWKISIKPNKAFPHLCNSKCIFRRTVSTPSADPPQALPKEWLESQKRDKLPPLCVDRPLIETSLATSLTPRSSLCLHSRSCLPSHCYTHSFISHINCLNTHTVVVEVTIPLPMTCMR